MESRMFVAEVCRRMRHRWPSIVREVSCEEMVNDRLVRSTMDSFRTTLPADKPALTHSIDE